MAAWAGLRAGANPAPSQRLQHGTRQCNIQTQPYNSYNMLARMRESSSQRLHRANHAKSPVHSSDGSAGSRDHENMFACCCALHAVCLFAARRRAAGWFTLQLTLAAAVTDSLDVPDEVQFAHARLGELVQSLAKHLSSVLSRERRAACAVLY